MYIEYLDDSKRPIEEKIRGILRLYHERHGRAASVVLTHPEQLVVYPSVLVVSGETRGAIVRKDCFWVGQN